MKFRLLGFGVVLVPENMQDAFQLGNIAARYSCTVTRDGGVDQVELSKEDVVKTLVNAAGRSVE